MEELKDFSKNRQLFLHMINEQQWMTFIYDTDWENNEKLNFVRIWFARTTGQDKHLPPVKKQTLENEEKIDNFGQIKLL